MTTERKNEPAGSQTDLQYRGILQKTHKKNLKKQKVHDMTNRAVIAY